MSDFETPPNQSASYSNKKFRNTNTALRDKLQQVFNLIPTPAVDKLRSINVNRIGIDGQDHILLDFYGATETGRLLAMNMRAHFDHPILGSFNSFKGLWYFLNSYERDDRMRDLTGMALEKFNRLMTPVHVPNVAAIALTILYRRIAADKHAAKVIKSSTLAFDCYWTNEAGLRRRQRWAYWLVPGAEEIRRALIAGREPDFSDFIDQLQNGETLDAYIAREFLDPQQREIAAKNKELKKEKKAADLLSPRKPRQPGPSRKELLQLEKAIAEENPDLEALGEDDAYLTEGGPADIKAFAQTIDQEEMQAEQQDQARVSAEEVQSEISEEPLTPVFMSAEETADMFGYIQAQEQARLKDSTEHSTQLPTEAA